jgi:hypothetical protein
MKMFRTERQRELSHFVAELKYNITEKCENLTDAEIEYVYATLASFLLNDVSKWTYEDLGEEQK